jgi:hypothetical protein
VAYDEVPIDPELDEHIEKMGGKRFRLQGAAPVAAVRCWLADGNWQMLSFPAPAELKDLVRATAEEVECFVSEHHLQFVIDSFHDNANWIVGLARQSS